MKKRLGYLAMAALACALTWFPASPVGSQVDPAGPLVPPTPKAECGPGSNPEPSAQGRVPRAEVDAGRAAKGYWCNAEMVAHVGNTGGYKVERYVDKAGRECAFYDTTLLFPANATNLSSGDLTGAAVLDMSDPAKPVKTATLVTPAMQSPHESMVLNQKRGLLAAVTANPVFYPGIVDIYDVSEDCRNPTLKASAPIGVLGHESGFAPDGNTFYVAALHMPVVTAIDVTDPMVPTVLGVYEYYSHGIDVSDDGNRLYMASYTGRLSDEGEPRGLFILDSSEIQSRKASPALPMVSNLTWEQVSTPQINRPITIDGKPYLVEMDEFGSGETVGAARIIDIADEKNPKVISNLRLEVNQASAHEGDQVNDYGTGSLQNYTGHYCNVPQREDPGIVACTFILSGLRVFDIRDPHNPKEIAYFNGPLEPGESSYAMSSPSFVPERKEIWYSDGNTGFYVVRLTNDVWPSAARSPSPAGATAERVAPTGDLPATGGYPVPLVHAAAAVGGLAMWRLRSRARVRRPST
jgi:hypothetical protein